MRRVSIHVKEKPTSGGFSTGGPSQTAEVGSLPVEENLSRITL